MEPFSLFTGIDVSKLWLDVAVLDPGHDIVYQQRIANEPEAIRLFLKELKSRFTTPLNRHLFCLEHTGKYGDAFLQAAARMKLHVWLELPLQIKRSQGLVRGKTDTWDAARIARYAYRFADKAVLFELPAGVIEKLKALQSKRSQLVKVHTMLIQENRQDPLFKKPVLALKQAIEAIEKKMEQLVEQSPDARRQYTLLKSIPGIGRQTALALIIVTRGFTRLTDSRKLSCYSGMAPFPYQSGSSVKGRTKVSKMGDLKLKTLLSLSAWNAMRSVEPLKAYYQRKVSQGKHKLTVINAIRNKLIAMALSIIERNTPFTKDYSSKALILP